jgi:hypothetical protein
VCAVPVRQTIRSRTRSGTQISGLSVSPSAPSSGPVRPWSENLVRLLFECEDKALDSHKWPELGASPSGSGIGLHWGTEPFSLCSHFSQKVWISWRRGERGICFTHCFLGSSSWLSGLSEPLPTWISLSDFLSANSGHRPQPQVSGEDNLGSERIEPGYLVLLLCPDRVVLPLA